MRAAIATALILSTLLVGLDTLVWFRLERTLDRHLLTFAATARAAGWRFGAQAGERGGWPFAATLTLVHPSLRGAAPLVPGGIDWSGEAVTLSLSPLHARRALARAYGTQSLTIAPGSSFSLLLRLWGADITIRLPDEAEAPRYGMVLRASALHVAVPGAGPDDILQVARLTADLHWRLDAPGDAAPAAPLSPAASLLLTVSDIALPIRLSRPDRRMLQRARLDATLTGRLTPRPMPIADALMLWQHSGGRLRISEASVEWGGGGGAVAGQAALRPDGLTDGGFDLALTDYPQALQRLRDAGLIGPGAAVASGAVLGLIDAAGPVRQLHLPLALQRGQLTLGSIPLLRIGTITPASPDLPPPVGTP